MYFSIIGFIPTIIILMLHVIHCQGQLQMSARITKTANCNITGLKWLLGNVTMHYRYPKTYLNGQYPVIEDIKGLNKVYLHIERCNDQGYDFEDFQNWKIERFCRMLTWKNQVWTDFMNHMQPTLRCPIKKADYEVRDFTFDINALINWYPDLTKYRWRATCKVLDDQDAVVFCGITEAYLYQFRIQDRKSPRKPRNY